MLSFPLYTWDTITSATESWRSDLLSSCEHRLLKLDFDSRRQLLPSDQNNINLW